MLLIYPSYQALFLFLLFLFSLLFFDNYYYWLVNFIFVYCSVIFFYGFIGDLYFNKFINIHGYKYLSFNNLFIHIIPFILLVIIFNYFYKNKKIIVTKYCNLILFFLFSSLFILNYFVLNSYKIYKKIWNISLLDFNKLILYIVYSILFLQIIFL